MACLTKLLWRKFTDANGFPARSPKKEAQNNSVDKLRKIVGMPVDNNNYLCDTNFLR